jgi:uncharacterized damage-inducible protein DinB
MAETAQQYTQRILGHMEGQDPMKVQSATPAKLKKLIQGLTPKQLKWQPGPGKWSIAEILAHLADAEIAGSWRMRLSVSASGTALAPFDQDSWAAEFQYQKRDAAKSLETFRVLRENNLTMLKMLPKESWERYGMHQERGKETVARIVQMFAGHDRNHTLQVEQIVTQLKTAEPKRPQLKKKRKK